MALVLKTNNGLSHSRVRILQHPLLVEILVVIDLLSVASY